MAVVFWSDRAIKNLKTIKDYIAIDSAFHAKKFIQNLIKTTDKQLSPMPNSGKKIEEFENSIFNHFRQLNYKGYRIIYEFDDVLDTITVLAVIHGRRHFDLNLLEE